MSAKELFAALLSMDNNVRSEAEVRIFYRFIFTLCLTKIIQIFPFEGVLFIPIYLWRNFPACNELIS